jgi:hypothetical protein
MITKFKSRNLFGETRKQEKRRLLREIMKSVLRGKSRNISFGLGTTKAQKRRRLMILKKAGLPIKMPKYFDMYE